MNGIKSGNHAKLLTDNIGYLIKIAVWETVGYDHGGEPNTLLQDTTINNKYKDLWAKENVAATLSTLNDNVVINKPAEGEFLQPTIDSTGKEVYGPFNITYPGYQSLATGKYEFVGDSLKILVNGKELSYLPESGEDFYLTEADGIVLGEENSISISYEANTIPVVRYTKYLPYNANLTLVYRCISCGGEFIVSGSGFYDTLRDIIYSNNLSETGGHNGDCQGTVRQLVQGASRKNQDVIMVSCENPNHIKENHEVKFWAGRKIEIDLTKIDNAKMPNALNGINFNVEISGDEKAFIKLDNGQRVTSTTITTDPNGQSKITIIACKETITVTLTEEDNIFYINNGPIVIDFTYNKNSKTWSANVRNSAQLRDVVSIVQQGEWFEFQLKIINIAKIVDLVITKLNKSVPGEVLPGIEFQIILKNATDMNNNSNLRVTTDANGNIRLGTLKVIDPNEDIVITITECTNITKRKLQRAIWWWNSYNYNKTCQTRMRCKCYRSTKRCNRCKL